MPAHAEQLLDAQGEERKAIGKTTTDVLDPRWVMRELGIRWKALGPGTRDAPKKKKWYALAAADKIRADREMKAYMAKHPEAASRAASLSAPADGSPESSDGAVSSSVLELFSEGALDPLPVSAIGAGKGLTLLFSDRQYRAASAATKHDGASALAGLGEADPARIGAAHDALACGADFEEVEVEKDQWAAAFDVTIVNGPQAWGDDRILAGHLKRSEQPDADTLPPYRDLLDINAFTETLAGDGESECPRCARGTTRCMCFFP
jgi:hypothetical protein